MSLPARPLASRAGERIAACLVVGAGWAGAAAAHAQAAHTGRTVTRVVGTPPGGARVDRVDARRSGRAPWPLPEGALRVRWRAIERTAIEHAPLVDARGGVYAVGARGEVTALGEDGSERWQVATGSGGASPGALLSDDTLVFVDGAGDVIAVRAGKFRWKAHLGATESAPAPLATDDGGLVAAAGAVLASIDASGQEIARVRLPGTVAAPLMAAGQRVLAVTAIGEVWAWAPGTPEASRLGTFESPVEEGALVLGNDRALAVTHAGTRLTELDLLDGVARARAASSGALWTGPPAAAGGIAYVVARTPSSELGMAFDAAGRELGSALLHASSLPPGADAGRPVLDPGRAAAVLVDDASTLVFATKTGSIGSVRNMLSPDPSVEVLAGVCPAVPSSSGSSVAGIAPLAPSIVVVTCRHGDIVAVGVAL